MQKFFLPLNILLTVSIIMMLALIGSDLVAYRLGKIFPPGPDNAKSSTPRPAAVEDLSSFSPILEKSLFGKSTQGKVSPIETTSAIKAAAPSVSQGDLLLLGTAVGSFRQTFALISKSSTKEERVFRLGENVFNVGPLVTVKKEMAEILAGGKKMKILSPAAAAESLAAPPPSVGGMPAGGLASHVGAGTYVIEQRALNAALDNIGQAMTDARLIPSMKDGKVEGFRASEVKPAGVFGMVGIKNGDVLLRINDFPIDSPEKAMQSFVALKGQSRIKLDLVRDGQPMTNTYDIR